jgi:hypothetical protein
MVDTAKLIPFLIEHHRRSVEKLKFEREVGILQLPKQLANITLHARLQYKEQNMTEIDFLGLLASLVIFGCSRASSRGAPLTGPKAERLSRPFS